MAARKNSDTFFLCWKIYNSSREFFFLSLGKSFFADCVNFWKLELNARKSRKLPESKRASRIPSSYTAVIGIGVGTKVSQEISDEGEQEANERHQDGQSPFWERFFGQLRNKRPDHQFLNLCKGKLPGHRGDQPKEESCDKVSEKHPGVLQQRPVHRIILEKIWFGKFVFVHNTYRTKKMNWISMWTR